MRRVGQPYRMGNMHLYFPWMLELASRPALLDMAEALLGPDVLIAGSVLLHKPPQRSRVRELASGQHLRDVFPVGMDCAHRQR